MTPCLTEPAVFLGKKAGQLNVLFLYGSVCCRVAHKPAYGLVWRISLPLTMKITISAMLVA